MKKFWTWLLGFFVGASGALLAAFLSVRKYISNTDVIIKRPKIKRSNESEQDFTTTITDVEPSLNKQAKRKGKKIARKAERLIKRQAKS